MVKSKAQNKGSRSAPKKTKTQQVTVKPVKTVTRPAPSSVSRISRGSFATLSGPGKYPGSLIVRGHDLLTQISFGNSDNPGYPVASSLYQVEINPTSAAFSGGRLSRYGALFDKYLFKNLRFHYEPAVPTSQPGSIVLAYDTDPVDPTPPATINGLQQYLSYRDSLMTTIWQAASLDCRVSSTQDFYFTSSNSEDERLFNQGQLYVALGIPMNQPTTLTVGNIWVEYEILLFDPTLDVPDELIVETPEATIFAVPSEAGSSVLVPLASIAAVPTNIRRSAGKLKFNTANQTVTNLEPGEYLFSLLAKGELPTAAAATQILLASLNLGPGLQAIPLTNNETEIADGDVVNFNRVKNWKIIIDSAVPYENRYFSAQLAQATTPVASAVAVPIVYVLFYLIKSGNSGPLFTVTEPG